jgi:hypothetical protein
LEPLIADTMSSQNLSVTIRNNALVAAITLHGYKPLQFGYNAPIQSSNGLQRWPTKEENFYRTRERWWAQLHHHPPEPRSPEPPKPVKPKRPEDDNPFGGNDNPFG